MNIPGLSIPGLSTGNEDLQPTPNIPTEPSPPRTHTIPAGSEYRFELPLKSTAPTSSFSQHSLSDTDAFTIKLTNGNAEIFGTELAPGNTYPFPPGAKAAVFTWTGAELEVHGEAESEFVAEETSMPEAANVHFALERLRPQQPDLPPSSIGPRVLLLGARSAGKTALAKLLAAYAQRLGRSPAVLNLDPCEAHTGVPGSLTAVVASPAALLDPCSASGWADAGVTGPSAGPAAAPVVYFFGMDGGLGLEETSTGGRELGGGGARREGSRRAVWRALVTRLALAVTSRMQEDAEVRAAGCIVDAPAGLADKKGYELVEHVVSEFSINVVLVLGSERLFSDMRRKFEKPGSLPGDEGVRVVKLAKSEGCVGRDEEYMTALRAQQIRGYFFGEKGMNLNPLTVMVGFDDVTIYRYSEASMTTSDTSYLPGADSDSESEYQPSLHPTGSTIFTKTNPSLALSNAILAIPHTSSPNSSQADLMTSSILGFAYVADVDEARKGIRLLVPAPMRLEGRTLIWGNWPEGVVDLLG
ncbi:MAG: Cleavage polyadenylation factor subunit clp1 [Bathelium mastoideum]|nr:MAG: Cleavage polyadenylation factor subunit clp1 [Bathelium mastoideum]